MTWPAQGAKRGLAPRPVRSIAWSSISVACRIADHAEFETDCGKGTYVRALARDLGRALGLFRPCRERCGASPSARLPKAT